MSKAIAFRSKKANEEYRRSPKGVLTHIYGKQVQRCRLKGIALPEYTLKEFQEWGLNDKRFQDLYDLWVKDNFKRNTRPSIDRRDPLSGYIWSNIQWMTSLENVRKGGKEKIILWGKPILQYKDGILFNHFSSLKEAAQATGIENGNISSCALGKRPNAGGYQWKYEGTNI